MKIFSMFITNNWIRRILYIYSIEYYISINNNELRNFAVHWVKFKDNIDGGSPDLGKKIVLFHIGDS